MAYHDNRSEERRKACVQAFASDLKDTIDIKCIIRDVSQNGCMIVSSQIQKLPDLIQLVPEGFDHPLNGMVVWRKTGWRESLFCPPKAMRLLIA